LTRELVNTAERIASRFSSAGSACQHPQVRAPEPIPRSAWIALYLTSVGQAIVILQSSVVNIAFVSIEASFPSTERATLAWIVTGYAIGSAALLLLAGRLADIYGRRRVFSVGVAIFSLASLAAGLAWAPGWLIAARVIQSVGGALMIPTSLSLVLPLFPDNRRSLVVGVWAAVAAVAGAAGPPLGAAIIELASWRWIFAINAPVGVAIVLLGRSVLAENTGRRAETKIDLVAVPLGTIGVALVVLGVLQGSTWGWLGGWTLGAFALGVVTLGVVVARSARHPEPLVDLTLFRNRPFSVASAVLLVFNTAVSGFWFAAPVFMRDIWGWSPLEAGLAVTPSPLAILLSAPLAGRIGDQGRLREGITAGMLTCAVGMVGMIVLLDAESNYWVGYLPWSILYGVGLGFSWSMLTSASLAGIPAERYGSANGTGLTARTIGGAFGVALVIAVVGSGAGETAAAFERVWVTLAVIFLVATVAFWLLYPRRSELTEAR
jgi:EmrB/QacA subfamily drug resistance transporter